MNNTKQEKPLLVQYQDEINTQLANQSIMESLVRTTFKGISLPQVKQAMFEGYQRGFNFQDFLKKRVYAIPFSGGYQLITSIDFARSVGQKNGIVGKEAPMYETDEQNKIISCTVTVKKKTGDYVGDYTSTVFFDEYYKKPVNGKPSLWDTKPHTMIAKVAEMHALRMACPEDLSNFYTEEEFEKEQQVQEYVEKEVDTTEAQKLMISCKTVKELADTWKTFTAEEKKELLPFKNELKEKLSKATKQPETTKEEPISDIIDVETV